MSTSCMVSSLTCGCCACYACSRLRNALWSVVMAKLLKGFELEAALLPPSLQTRRNRRSEPRVNGKSQPIAVGHEQWRRHGGC